MNLAHQQELRYAASEHEQELKNLRSELETAAAETISLKATVKALDASRTEAEDGAVLRQEQALRDATSENKQAIDYLRHQHESVIQERDTLQRALHDVDQKHGEAAGQLLSLQESLKDHELKRREADVETNALKDKLELADKDIDQCRDTIAALERDGEGVQAQVADLSREVDRQSNEASVDITLLKDKLELADREKERQSNAVTALKDNLDGLRSQLADASEDLQRERNEAAVDLTILKDKLELAELQRQSASEDITLSRNEANLEITILKDKLELADLETQQDKKATTALEERLRELETSVPDTDQYFHHQLRDELAMLASHHAANLADVEALKTSILAERKVREEEWRRRAEGKEHLAKKLEAMSGELSSTVGGH